MNVPNFLIEMLEKQYGKELTSKILKGYQTKRVVTLRVNTLKSTMSDIQEILREEKIDFEEVLWNRDALIIKNADESKIYNLDICEDGKIYLQSLSSMLPPIILKPQEGENILDMASAPGSKTTQIAAITNNKANITACEMNSIRAERLKYNLKKQGVECAYVMVTDSRRLDDLFSFDKILLDAPCSGSGTISDNYKNIEKNFTQTLIHKSCENQLSLLKKALKILKPGQEMVYSTCSILECENEEILKKALNGTNAEIVPIEIQNTDKIPLLPVKIPGTICICPNELYEGFFVAKIKLNK